MDTIKQHQEETTAMQLPVDEQGLALLLAQMHLTTTQPRNEALILLEQEDQSLAKLHDFMSDDDEMLYDAFDRDATQDEEMVDLDHDCCNSSCDEAKTQDECIPMAISTTVARYSSFISDSMGCIDHEMKSNEDFTESFQVGMKPDVDLDDSVEVQLNPGGMDDIETTGSKQGEPKELHSIMEKEDKSRHQVEENKSNDGLDGQETGQDYTRLSMYVSSLEKVSTLKRRMRVLEERLRNLNNRTNDDENWSSSRTYASVARSTIGTHGALAPSPFPLSDSQKTPRTVDYHADLQSEDVELGYRAPKGSKINSNSRENDLAFGQRPTRNNKHRKRIGKTANAAQFQDLSPYVKELMDKELRRSNKRDGLPCDSSTKAWAKTTSVVAADAGASTKIPTELTASETVTNKAAEPPEYGKATLEPRTSTNEVCIILDSSNATMEKFLAPLLSNLSKFWDLLSSSSEQKLRMSIVTPEGTLDFTSEKSNFLSFVPLVTREFENNAHDSCVIRARGLARALTLSEEMSWSDDSQRFIYIFTRLCNSDNDDEQMGHTVTTSLVDAVGQLKDLADVFVGCRMDNNEDNEPLLEALRQKNRKHQRFAFLNVKEMASFVVGCNDLLEALFASLVMDKQKTHVRLTEKKSGPSSHGKSSSRPAKIVTTKAKIYQVTPPQSIQEVISITKQDLVSKDCWLQRESRISAATRDIVLSSGRLGYVKGEWKENVVLKELKVDMIKGDDFCRSMQHFKSQAFVAAAAEHLATLYNQEYRPERCAHVRFLRGYIIKEFSLHGEGQVFYAEQRVPSRGKGIPRFTEYCDAAGVWNETTVDESLLRFVQTCFKLSGGDFMLAGLKGMRVGDKYILSVPSWLSRTSGNVHANDCNKEYMKNFRNETKALLEKNGWNQKRGEPQQRGWSLPRFK